MAAEVGKVTHEGQEVTELMAPDTPKPKKQKAGTTTGRRSVDGAWIVFDGATPSRVEAEEIDALRVTNGSARVAVFVPWGGDVQQALADFNAKQTPPTRG